MFLPISSSHTLDYIQCSFSQFYLPPCLFNSTYFLDANTAYLSTSNSMFTSSKQKNPSKRAVSVSQYHFLRLFGQWIYLSQIPCLSSKDLRATIMSDSLCLSLLYYEGNHRISPENILLELIILFQFKLPYPSTFQFIQLCLVFIVDAEFPAWLAPVMNSIDVNEISLIHQTHVKKRLSLSSTQSDHICVCNKKYYFLVKTYLDYID